MSVSLKDLTSVQRHRLAREAQRAQLRRMAGRKSERKTAAAKRNGLLNPHALAKAEVDYPYLGGVIAEYRGAVGKQKRALGASIAESIEALRLAEAVQADLGAINDVQD